MTHGQLVGHRRFPDRIGIVVGATEVVDAIGPEADDYRSDAAWVLWSNGEVQLHRTERLIPVEEPLDDTSNIDSQK